MQYYGGTAPFEKLPKSPPEKVTKITPWKSDQNEEKTL